MFSSSGSSSTFTTLAADPGSALGRQWLDRYATSSSTWCLHSSSSSCSSYHSSYSAPGSFLKWNLALVTSPSASPCSETRCVMAVPAIIWDRSGG